MTQEIDESNCLFCKIVRKEIPCKKIYEDKYAIAFLDINPANDGHTLVLPKKHVPDIFGADEEILNRTIEAVHNVATLIKDRLNPDGINILQNNGQHAGQLVHHIHFHIIPRYQGDKVMIHFPREQADEARLNEIFSKLTEEPEKEFDMEL